MKRMWVGVIMFCIGIWVGLIRFIVGNPNSNGLDGGFFLAVICGGIGVLLIASALDDIRKGR